MTADELRTQTREIASGKTLGDGAIWKASGEYAIGSLKDASAQIIQPWLFGNVAIYLAVIALPLLSSANFSLTI
ncbi:MAG: hypothetical protein H6890_05005 [Brucellaceae bacterium]|nr:hypothetical protein [Brucellaceae bacterium]